MVRGRLDQHDPPARTEHPAALAAERGRIDVHEEILAGDQVHAGVGERQALHVAAQRRDPSGDGGILAGGAAGQGAQPAERDVDRDDRRAAPGAADRRQAVAGGQLEDAPAVDRPERRVGAVAGRAGEAPEGGIGLRRATARPLAIVGRR